MQGSCYNFGCCQSSITQPRAGPALPCTQSAQPCDSPRHLKILAPFRGAGCCAAAAAAVHAVAPPRRWCWQQGRPVGPVSLGGGTKQARYVGHFLWKVNQVAEVPRGPPLNGSCSPSQLQLLLCVPCCTAGNPACLYAPSPCRDRAEPLTAKGTLLVHDSQPTAVLWGSMADQCCSHDVAAPAAVNDQCTWVPDFGTHAPVACLLYSDRLLYSELWSQHC